MDPETRAPDALDAYRSPSQRVLDKEIGSLDAFCRDFIALAPFATLATASADGWPDVSPRGGAPGFVHVLDAHRLALPDRLGNNRIDSLRNIARDPRVALLFLIPGCGEALRVNGTARIVAGAPYLSDLAVAGVRPDLAVEVTVAELFLHCSKAFVRSAAWDPRT